MGRGSLEVRIPKQNLNDDGVVQGRRKRVLWEAKIATEKLGLGNEA